MPHQTFRIIDANLNRMGEGLRLLEDIARFLLNDAVLSKQLKDLRHELVQSTSKFGTKILSQRDAKQDIGINIETIGEQKREDLACLITANARRVEEALRVVEEVTKLPEVCHVLDSNQFKDARFNLYTIERTLFSKAKRYNIAKGLKGLYVIIDTQTLEKRDIVDITGDVIRGGASAVQLRDKYHSKGDLLPIARRLKDLCYDAGILFIINDYLDIVLAVDADGIHIGQKDLPLSVVREELPIDKIIGCSTAKLSQALKAEADGVDYIAVGSVFPSPTKKDATTIGLEALCQIRRAVSIPIVAIGGINKDNIAKVIDAGANSAAVISAALTEENIEESVRHLVRQIE